MSGERPIVVSNSNLEHRPRVSIGVPVFNGEDYLESALDSLLAQTFSDLEIIIGDNASTDGTEAICRAAAEKDSRVRYIRHEKNLGAAPNYNLVFEVSRGEFFKWAAHDDICAPTLIEKCVQILDNNEDVALAAPRTRIIDAAGQTVRDLDPEMELQADDSLQRLREFFVFHLSPQACNPVFGLYRREILARTGLIGSYPASDMILLAHIAMEGKLVLVQEPLFLRRYHPNTSVKKNPDMKDRAQWFNTQRTHGVQLIYWRWCREYLRSVWSSSLGFSQRVTGTGIVLRWAFRQRWAFMRDLKKIPAALKN